MPFGPVCPARLVEQGARARRIERIARDSIGVRPRHRLDGTVRDRRETVEDGLREELAIERVDQRAPDAHVGKRRKVALVQRHVLVGVAGRLVHDDRGQTGELAVLVPRHQRDDVHLAALQLVDARVRVRDELEHQPADTGQPVAAPVVRHALEQDVFASFPLRDAIRPGAERTAVVVLRAIDVAPLEQMARQRAADELDVVRRVDLLVVDDRGQRIRCVDRADAIEPVGAFGVVVGTVDRVDGELDVGGREGTPSCHVTPGRSVQVTSMPPSGRSRTPPFSSVGTSVASSGITFICSSVVVRPSTMQVWMSSRMCVLKRLSVSGSRS